MMRSVFKPTFISFLWTVMVIQLSVEKAMASRAAATRLKMVAKARVTALQKPMVLTVTIYWVTILPITALPALVCHCLATPHPGTAAPKLSAR